jgi:hypothetical protein
MRHSRVSVLRRFCTVVCTKCLDIDHVLSPSHPGLKNIEIDGTAAFFQAGLDCEAATIVSGPSGCSDRQCHGLNVSLTIASTTCNIKSYNLTTGCDMRPDAVICKLNETWGVGCDTHADGHGKNRLVFMNGYMKQDLHGADTNGTGPLEIFVHNTSTILCEPQYGLAETFVTVDQNGNIKNSPQLTTDTSRLEFPAWDLVDGLLTATTAAGTSLGQGYAYNSYDFFPWETLHDFFLKWVDVAYPLSDLTDQSVLQFRAEEWFSMTMAQMAKQSLMQPSTVSALGTCHGVQDRLRIRGLSLYLMGSILVLLIGFTIALLYIVPRRYSSRDSTSIGGLALAISQSPSLLARLSAYGSANLKTISRQLESTECETRLIRHDQGWQLAIDLTSNKVTEHPDAAPTEAETLYWQPLSLRSMFKVLVTACLVAIIVVLEILYSVSQKRNGLVKVDPTTDQRFAWAYIPAIVMVTIQTLVRMTAFSALMVFPYFQLRRQDTSTRQDVLRSYVSETAMKSLWQAVVAKHIVVFCMALATLLAPILTIAVSGLYTAVPTSEDIPITLSVHEQFNSSFRPIDLWFGVYGEMSMAASNDIGLLLTQNFTFPAWTYDEVALPKASMNLPNTLLPNSRALAGSNVTMRLPGIRSSLNCSLAPSAPTNFTNILGRNSANVTAFEVLDVDFLPWPRPGAQPFGFFTACGPSSSKDMHNTYCGAFGTSEVNWKAFTCGSRIDELDVDVALDAASLLVLAARPNESTARFFSNETLCSGLRDAFPSDMIPALFGGADFGGQKAYAGFYDPAFQAVVYGLGTRIRLEDFPMESYMNNEGASHIFDQLQHIHRILVAQSANLIRMPLNATSPLAPPATVTATLVNPHVYRLKQNAVSTRILDGLLVAIALCVAASFLMDTRKVLPKNPASIAAATSLIAAESRMLSKESLPEGAQWYSDTELKVKRVWDGAFFRLGWWDGDDPSEPESTLFKLDTL